MPTFNLKRITEQRKTIEDNLRQLEARRATSFDDLISDADALDAAKYRLQTAVQAMIDISNHLCARLRLKIAQDSGECIRALEKAGRLTHDDATMYVKMIRFRNVLVHLYGEVDNHRVYEIIEHDLDYFHKFLMDVDAIVAASSKREQGKLRRRDRP